VVVAVDDGQTHSLPHNPHQRGRNHIPFRDPRDFAGAVLLIDTAQRQFGLDRARKRFIRGDQSVECDVVLAKEICEASVRTET